MNVVSRSQLTAAMRTRLMASGRPRLPSSAVLTMGADTIDLRLCTGLARAAVHEIFAEAEPDGSAAAGFALAVALRASPARPMIWVREDRGVGEGGRLYAPGLVEMGIDPDRLFVVTAPNALGVLRAGADSVGCGAVGAVLIEPWGAAPLLDLTASRRLALMAARSGVLTLVLRVGGRPAPSAAATRWSVRAAPSAALDPDAPGLPTFDISLLRHRGGIAGFDARVEWDRDRQSFRDAALSRRLPAVAAVGAGFEARRAA